MTSFLTGIHPRLRYRHANNPHGTRTIDELRARARDATGDILPWLLDGLIAAADADAADDPIVATPEQIGRACRGAWMRIKTAGVAFALTGDEKYFQAVRRQAFSMCDDWCDWLDPCHVAMGCQSDLRTGHALWAMGLAYDEFHHLFTAEERRRLATGIRERGFARWLKDRNSLTMYDSNWCVCVAGGVGVAAMATLEDIPESAELAELTSEHVPRMLEGFGADGDWPEGVGYWNGTAMVVEYLDILRNASAGKLDYVADERLRQTCWFPLYCAMPPDGLANFGDGDYAWGLETLPAAAVAGRQRDPQLQWAVHLAVERMQRGLTSTSSDNLGQLALFYDPTVPATLPGADIPLSRHFRDLGWVAIRNGWDDRDPTPCIVCKAHSRERGCPHHDAGNLIVNACGGRMLCDYGYGNGIPAWIWLGEPDADGRHRRTDPLYSTSGHNVVVIGGRCQDETADSEITMIEHDDGIGVAVRINVAAAYPNVKRAERIIVHLRPGILAVLDDFELERAEAAWLSWHLPEIAMSEDFPADGDIAERLTAIEEGRFRRAGPQGTMTAMCVSLSSGDVRYGHDAHRRIGLVDRAGQPMPPFIYPYVRTAAGPSRHHCFLSVFAFQADGGTDAWQATGDGAVFSRQDERIAVVTRAGGTVAEAASNARLIVSDGVRSLIG